MTEHRAQSMSVEDTLRRVAARMRADWPVSPQRDAHDNYHRAAEFHQAVAAWLDVCALVTEVAPDRHKGNALTVARAYLGEGE